MPRYDIRWCTEAERTLDSLPHRVRTAVDAFVKELKENPKAHGTYNKKFDYYSADFEYGFIHYAVVDQVLRVLLLRITAVY
ncbi:type II toxin-antitoxin system RelE family toxin [Saccharopolyspora sp. NPDC002376]